MAFAVCMPPDQFWGCVERTLAQVSCALRRLLVLSDDCRLEGSQDKPDFLGDKASLGPGSF